MAFVNRVLAAARLDARVFEDVEADPGAIGQAMTVVALSSLAAGVGMYSETFSGLVVGVITALFGWFVWAFLTYVIGTRLLPQPQTDADLGQMLRTLGFAAAPGLLNILGLIRPVSGLVLIVVSIWMLAATVVAVRQALDYDNTWRALGVCVIGWLIQGAISAALLFLLPSGAR